MGDQGDQLAKQRRKMTRLRRLDGGGRHGEKKTQVKVSVEVKDKVKSEVFSSSF